MTLASPHPHPALASPPKGLTIAAHELRRALGSHDHDLYGRAVRLCRNEAWAHDLVQDTLERALRFERQYRPDSNLRAWLQRILLRVFLTQCRRRGRERRAFELLMNDPSAWTSPDAPAAPQTLSAPAARALATLPAHFQEALQLVDVAGCSYRDAAEVLGVPIGTIMSRLHRGRRLLAERWTGTSVLSRAA